MSTCQITRDSAKNIVEVTDSLGNPSRLYQQALAFTDNPEMSAKLVVAAENPAMIDYFFPSGASNLKSTFKEVVKNPNVISDLRSLIGLENTNSLIINDTQKSVIYDEIEKEVNRSGDRVAKEFSNRMRMGDIDTLKGLRNSMYKNYYVKELANTIINSEEAKPFNEEFAKRSISNDTYIVDNIDNLIQIESLFDDTEVKFDKALDFYKNAVSGEIIEKEMTLNNSRENLRLILGDQFPVNEIVDTMIDTGMTYGYFEESAIYLSKNAPLGTEYHEAFHAVFRTMLSDKQVAEYLEVAKQEMDLTPAQLQDSINKLRSTYPNLTDAQLENIVYEEYMADGYMDFAVKEIPTTSALVALFNLIKNFVLSLVGNRTKIQSLYYKLNNRGFKQAPKQHSLSKFLLPIRMYKNLIYTVPSKTEKGLASTKEVMLPANESLSIIQNIGARLFAEMEKLPVENRTTEQYKNALLALIKKEKDTYNSYVIKKSLKGGLIVPANNKALAQKHLQKEGVSTTAANYQEILDKKQTAISDKANRIVGALNTDSTKDADGNVVPSKNMETFWNTLRGLYAAVPNNPFARSYASVMAAEAVDSIYKDDNEGNDDVARFGASANEKGGFDIVSDELKAFYSLLSKKGHNDFLLEDGEVAVDGQALHATLISALSNRDLKNRDVYETLVTMSKLSGNEDVKALVDKVEEYSKLDPDAEQGNKNVDYNSQIINQIRSAYQLYDKQRDSMLVDSNRKAIQKVSDNNMVSEQLERWATMWGYTEELDKGLVSIALQRGEGTTKYKNALTFMKEALTMKFFYASDSSSVMNITITDENIKLIASILSGASSMTFDQFFTFLYNGKQRTHLTKYLTRIGHSASDLVPNFQQMFGIDMAEQTAHLLVAASLSTNKEFDTKFKALIDAHEANALPFRKKSVIDESHKTHIANAVMSLIKRAKDATDYNFYDKVDAGSDDLLYDLQRISALNSVFDNRYSEFSTQTADGQTVYSFMLDAYNARSVRELGKNGFRKLKSNQSIRRDGKLSKYGNSVQRNYFVTVPEELQKAIFSEDNDSKPIDAGDIRQDKITAPEKGNGDFVEFKEDKDKTTESKIGKTAKSGGNKEYMLLRLGNFASRVKKQTKIERTDETGLPVTDEDGNVLYDTVEFEKAKYIPGVYEAKNQIELKSLPVGVWDSTDKVFKQFLDTDSISNSHKTDRDRMFITTDGKAAMYQLFEKELEDMNSILSFVKDNIQDYKTYTNLSNAIYQIGNKNLTSGELIEYFNTLEAKAKLGYADEVELLETYKESNDASYKAYTNLLEIRTRLGETENHLVDGFHISLKTETEKINGVDAEVPVVKLGRAFDNWNFKFTHETSKAFAESHKAVKKQIEKQLTAYFYSDNAEAILNLDGIPAFTDFLNNNQNEKKAIADSIVKHLKEDYDKAIAAFIEEGLLSVDDKGRMVNQLLPIPASYVVQVTKGLAVGDPNYVAGQANTYKSKDLEATIIAFVQDMVMNQFFNVTNYNNMVDIHPAIAKNAADRVKRYGGHVAYGKRSLEGHHTVAYVEQINLLQDDLYTMDEEGRITYGSDFIKKKVSDYINTKYPNNGYDITNIGKKLLEEALDKTKLYEEEQANGQAYIIFDRAMSIKTQLGAAKKEVVNSSFQVLENGELSLESISPIAKIRFGLPLTWSEKSLLEENNLIFNSVKGVYYDAERYHKLSYAILTRELTSYLPKENAEQAKQLVNEILVLEETARRMYNLDNEAPAKKDLIDRAKALEVVYEDLFKPLPGRTKSHNLRRAMIAQGVDEVLPKSASKLNSTMLAKPQTSPDNNQSSTYDFSYNREMLANDHWALQVEMPTGKTMVTYFTQMISLIDNEQNDDNDSVTIKGMKLEDVKAAYQKALSDRVKNAVEMALSELAKMPHDATQVVTFEAFDENTLVDYENLIGRLQETLIRSGADDSLLEFFKLDSNNLPVHDVNSFTVEAKFQQLFNAMFSDGVMKAKSFGRKMSLISDYGFNVVRDENGKVVPMKTVLANPEKYANAKTSRLKWSQMKERMIFKDSDGVYKDVNDSKLSQEAKNEVLSRFTDLREKAGVNYTWEEFLETNMTDEIALSDLNITVEKSFGTAEIMMPAHTRELYGLKIGDEIPAHLLEGFGVRIPTQDKHSMISFIVVDFLPVYMGDVAVCPTEICSISGADYDIDSLYTLLNEYYTEKNEDGKEELVSFNSMPRENESDNELNEEAYNKYTDRLYKEYLTYQEMYNSNYARIKSMTVGEDYEYNMMKAEVEVAKEMFNDFARYASLLSLDNSESNVITQEDFEIVFEGLKNDSQNNSVKFSDLMASINSNNEFANIIKNRFHNLVEKMKFFKSKQKAFNKINNTINLFEKQLENSLFKEQDSFEEIAQKIYEEQYKISEDLVNKSKEKLVKAEDEYRKAVKKTAFLEFDFDTSDTEELINKLNVEIANLAFYNLEKFSENIVSSNISKKENDENLKKLNQSIKDLKSQIATNRAYEKYVKFESEYKNLKALNEETVWSVLLNESKASKNVAKKANDTIEEISIRRQRIVDDIAKLKKQVEIAREEKTQAFKNVLASSKIFNSSFTKKVADNKTIYDFANSETENEYNDLLIKYGKLLQLIEKSVSVKTIAAFDAKKESLELAARKKARIYADKKSFVDAWKATGRTPEERRDMNNASVGNNLLRINTMLYSNSTMEEIALTPSSMDLIDNVVAKWINDILGTKASSRPLNTVMGQTETKHANAVGKILIGPAAITNITKALLSKHFRMFAPEIKGITFEDATLESGIRKYAGIGDYETIELSIEQDSEKKWVIVNKAPGEEVRLRIMDIISTILSAATDNVKNNGMANMRFDINLLPSYLYMVSLGTGLNRVGLVSAQPIMKLFSKLKNDERPDNIQTSNQRINALGRDSFKKATDKMLDYFSEQERAELLKGLVATKAFPAEAKLLESLTIIGDASKALGVSNDIDAIMNKIDSILAAQPKAKKEDFEEFKKEVEFKNLVLKFKKDMLNIVIPVQLKSLNAFNSIKGEVSAFTRASKLIGLNKGLKPTHFENNMIEDTINEQNPFFGKSRELIDNNPSLQSNLDTLTRIVNVFASKVCTSQTPFVKEAFLQLRGLFGMQGSTPENLEKLQSDFTHFLQLKAYLYRDKSTNNRFVDKLPLLFSSGADGIVNRLAEVVKNNPELATNAFLKSLNNSFKESKSDASNGINIVKINSRFKESKNVINKKINAFEEMLYSPSNEVREFAKDLVDYLLLKDGLNYKNGSYLKYVPASALQDLSDATKQLVLGDSKVLHNKSKYESLTALLLEDTNSVFEGVFGVSKKTLFDEFIYSFASQESNSLSFTASNIDKADKKMSEYFDKDETVAKLFKHTNFNKDFTMNDLGIDDMNTVNKEISVFLNQYYKLSPIIKKESDGKFSYSYFDKNDSDNAEGLDEVASKFAEFIIKKIPATGNGLVLLQQASNDAQASSDADFLKKMFKNFVSSQKKNYADRMFSMNKAEGEDYLSFESSVGIMIPRVIVTQYTDESTRKVYTIKEYESSFDVLQIDEKIAEYEAEAERLLPDDKEAAKKYFRYMNSLKKFKKSMLTHVLANKVTFELVDDNLLSGLNPYTFSTFEEKQAAHDKLIEIRTANVNNIVDEARKAEALEALESFKNKEVISGKINPIISGGNLTDNELETVDYLQANKENPNVELDNQIQESIKDKSSESIYSKLSNNDLIVNLPMQKGFTDDIKQDIDKSFENDKFIVTSPINPNSNNIAEKKQLSYLLSTGAIYYERAIGKSKFGFWHLPQDNVLEEVNPDLFKILETADFGTKEYLDNVDVLTQYDDIIRNTQFRTRKKDATIINKVKMLNNYRKRLLRYTDAEFAEINTHIENKNIKGFYEKEKEFSKRGLIPQPSHLEKMGRFKYENREQLNMFESNVVAPVKESINIYSTDKNGFEKLSNLLNGPVTVDNLTFQTVEHAYQYAKAMFANDSDTANKILEAKTGWEAQTLGKTVAGLDSDEWNKSSTQILESIMRQAFEQNEESRNLLLKTGDAILTHKSSASLGKWGKVFPELLMKIREELNKNIAPENNNNQSLAESIYNKLGNKTESENVVLPNNLGLTYISNPNNFWSEIEPFFRKNYPNGLVAFRGKQNNFNIGNPFDWQKHGVGKATKMFIDWIITGNNHNETKATDDLRKDYLEKIKRSKGEKILYYAETRQATHATALDYLINKYDWGNQTPEQKNNNSVKVIKHEGFWTREEVAKQTDKVFLFGDNTDDRINTKYVPTSTQAVIRGLPNAIGIDTKKDRGTGSFSYFTDSAYDFLKFKQQVDEAIQQARNTGKTIVIPADGIGTGKAMLEQKAPKSFRYLQKALSDLYSNDYKFNGYVSVLENKSTNNWYGDAKDGAMRKVAGGFIGELLETKSSIGESSMVIESQFHDEPVGEDSIESFFVEKGKPTIISGGTTYSEIVMLARDDAFSGKPLDENTKQAIKKSHETGSIFVVGDMPNVDSQFIDYLKEIGATFEIYHTGDTPRIVVDKAPEQKIENDSTSILSGVVEPKLLKNEDGLIIIENAIPLQKTIEIVESSKDLITETSFKQTQGSISWGWGMQWLRITPSMTIEQRKGIVIGKQLNGKAITQAMKDNFIATGDIKGMPLYAYTTVDRNGKTLPNIPNNIIQLLLEKGIDVSEYDASYNSVYDKADNGSLIIHQDNTENNKSPIITISLGRPMKFITYELNNENDFNMVDPVNTAYRTAVNTVEGEAVKLRLIPESAYDDKGKVKYGHLTPNTLLKYAKEIDKTNANSKFPSNTYELVEETLKAQFKDGVKTEYTLENGAILVFSGKNRNVLHEIVFDENTNKQPMPDGFPELIVNKAFKGLGHKDKLVKTTDYRVVLTLRKVEGDAINPIKQAELLKSFSSGAIEQSQNNELSEQKEFNNQMTSEVSEEQFKKQILQFLEDNKFIEHKCF